MWKNFYAVKMDLGRLFHISLLLLLQTGALGGSLYQCMLPFQHCLGSFLPVGYSMQTVDIPTAIDHLNRQCPNLGNVETCTRQFRCGHDASRRRLEAYLWFFNWLCQNTHVLEEGRDCWAPPFRGDVITCGNQHIAGTGGVRLIHNSHPCPFVQGMVLCMRRKMQARAECSERVTELYMNVIIQSSITFSSCDP
ncbi:hypothetical protein ACOMHN_013600 [Nucella lapillus]